MSQIQKALTQGDDVKARLRARCIDDGGCWIWQGSTNGAGHPKVGIRTEDGRTAVSARRVMWEAVNGPAKARNLVTVTCGQAKCLNPDHLALTTKREVSRKANAQIATKAKRTATSAATNRPLLGKITMEIAREIRASDKSGIDIARELGVSPSLVSKVRLNQSWRETSSPFAGLVRG